jgi:hypothetical protein
MTRRVFIELIRRQIYGGQPNSDAEITPNLVNKWLDLGIAAAAKKNYADNGLMEGISYVNNSFYTTYKNLSVSNDSFGVWKIQLPQIPLGLGTNEGMPILVFKDNESVNLSFNVVWLSQNQRSYQRGMRTIPNKLLAYSEGEYIYVESTVQLSQYTAQVTMVSGGSTGMDSTINVPDDYMPLIVEYIKQQLSFERMQPKDIPDGQDSVRTV